MSKRFDKVLLAFRDYDEHLYAPNLVDRGVYQYAQPAYTVCQAMEVAGLLKHEGIDSYSLTHYGKAKREALLARETTP